ncbi:MAG: hypothetical protein NTX97_05040 [Bacteroidetes bacterium]|nr:hypothetical protein [Bacteroidota bacterium]
MATENKTLLELSDNEKQDKKELVENNTWEIDDRAELFLKNRSKKNKEQTHYQNKYWGSFGKIMGL